MPHAESLDPDMVPLIPDDEPVFLLRSMDASAPVAVRAWANDVERRGGDPELVSKVRAWANEMEQHADDNGGPKTADTPRGMLR